MAIETSGTVGSVAALLVLADAVKKGGAMAASSIGGLSGAFIPVSEDWGMSKAAEVGAITIDRLEAMMAACNTGVDMVAIPGDTPPETIAGIVMDVMAVAVVLDRLVQPGRISLSRMIELFTTGPARAFSLDCGRLEVGGAADVTILNPDLEWAYDVNRSFSKSRNSPFHGTRFRGAAVATVVDGAIVWSRA